MDFAQLSSKFWQDLPSDESALQLYRGNWHSEIEGKSIAQIRAELSENLFCAEDELKKFKTDLRVRWCSDVWAELNNMNVVELGPADGFHTYQLEAMGANVLAIEGNYDAFLRCLVLKNAMSMRSRFWLGNFLHLFDNKASYDLVFACGVLYHLQDPLGFLQSVINSSKRLFVWTHYYDDTAIQHVNHEREGFQEKITSERSLLGQSYTYHHKFYNTEHVSSDGYIGGLNESASWLSKADLMRAIDALGFKVLKVLEDDGADQMPAINLWLERIDDSDQI